MYFMHYNVSSKSVLISNYIVLIRSFLVVLPIREEVDHVHLLLGEGLLEDHVPVDGNEGLTTNKHNPH